MKTKKTIFTNRGGKYPFYKQAFMEKLAGKIVNIFWRYVDNSSCKMEKLALITTFLFIILSYLRSAC